MDVPHGSYNVLTTPDVVQIHVSSSSSSPSSRGGIGAWASERALFLAWAALAFIVVNYLVQLSHFHSVNRAASKETPQTPPKYPSLIPWLGHALPFAFDNWRFMDRVTSYKHKLTSCLVTVCGIDLYLLQDADTVAHMRHESSVGHVVQVYTYTMKWFFGLPEKGVEVYLRDKTGPERKPLPGSDPNFPARNRIYNITYQGFLTGLSGPNLGHTTKRYTELFKSNLDKMSISSTEWTHHDDMGLFFQEIVSKSILEAIFGPAFLKLNPTFNEELWEFDRDIPWLARCLPSFILPGAYRRRASLAAQVKRWHKHARDSYTGQECIGPDGDADPYWGSELMRHRHSKLPKVDDFDDDCLVAADLGFIWASVSNATPTVTWVTAHLFEDDALRDRARSDVARLGTLDPKTLCQSSPVLSSVFAETLRLHSTMYSMLTARGADANLGKWRLPEGHIGVVSTGLSHLDDEVWNTKEGRYPLSSFWADRFLVYPEDPTSGPLNMKRRQHALATGKPKAKLVEEQPEYASSGGVDANDPVFSLEGLEGSWIPYGAGRHACPGRVLSKQMVVHTCALMASQYDIELVDGPVPVEKDSWSFGFNVAVPMGKIPFRIRKREMV
ncbi:cytochrome P450 [Cladorrhinum sp. PSN332]|nr:cytochrome P450 [Cladorrhinum sp. PSN332]